MQPFVTRIRAFVLLTLILPVLAGCGWPTFLGAGAAGIYETRTQPPPPADLSLQMPQHETWCYETMGQPQCFAHPQPGGPDRLIMVDPPSRYPLTVRDYDETLIESH